MLRDMSNQKYSNTNPFAHERNTNVNFNYVWDENDSNWIPMQYPLEIKVLIHQQQVMEQYRLLFIEH